MCRHLVFILAYYEQGILVYDVTKLRHHYIESPNFKSDVISLLPTDIVQLVMMTSYSVIVRLNRVVRLRRVFEFFERTESSTNSGVNWSQ